MKNPIQMIKQCVEKEEPYFVLRGQDVCALAAIETYYEEVRNKVKDPYFIEEIEEIMKDFRAYREEVSNTKIPDREAQPLYLVCYPRAYGGRGEGATGEIP